MRVTEDEAKYDEPLEKLRGLVLEIDRAVSVAKRVREEIDSPQPIQPLAIPSPSK
jgi:hypothetical protein